MNCSLPIIDLFVIPIADIAFVAAELSFGIPIDNEGFSTCRAGEMVQGLGCPFDQILVAVPPLLATSLAAEDQLLSFSNLDKGLSTLFAGAFWLRLRSREKALPDRSQAVGFHRTLEQGEGCCDAPVAPAHLMHLMDLFLLGISHGKPPMKAFQWE